MTSLILPIAILWSAFSPSPCASAGRTTLAGRSENHGHRRSQLSLHPGDFEWDTYEKVIDEIDEYDTGTIYYRRQGKEIEMKAEVKKAGSEPQEAETAAEICALQQRQAPHLPAQDGPDERNRSSKNKAELEAYLVLGFGGSGQELLKAFDVTYQGPETINGVATAKLQLIPKSEKVRNYYSEILLWIDLDKGISVQQQFFTAAEDYRLIKYSAIQVNGKKITDDVFKLKTTSN